MTKPGFIPFHPMFFAQIEKGIKRMTTRTKRYGKPGDVLDYGNADGTVRGRIRLVATERVPLCVVAEKYHREEGFADPDGFQRAWCDIHPGRGWMPELRVWLHTFAPVAAQGGGK